jgi:hypothetical protein
MLYSYKNIQKPTLLLMLVYYGSNLYEMEICVINLFESGKHLLKNQDYEKKLHFPGCTVCDE